MLEQAQPKSESSESVSLEVMKFLRLWHERMAHANLKAVVVLARQGDIGEMPEGFPKGHENGFEGLQPYMDRLNCDTCTETYGNPSGPASW
ncbi:hypothetical protein RRF57_003236 [Xylaria bambusicola]|uniref:Uncharacterized protein n=1 Tax=Xylaria bambusicola TaxID=326684 RepID=A0AAN7ULG8_9PEZI